MFFMFVNLTLFIVITIPEVGELALPSFPSSQFPRIIAINEWYERKKARIVREKRRMVGKRGREEERKGGREGIEEVNLRCCIFSKH